MLARVAVPENRSTLKMLVPNIDGLEDPLDCVSSVPQLIFADDVLASNAHHLVVFLQEEIEHWENVLEY